MCSCGKISYAVSSNMQPGAILLNSCNNARCLSVPTIKAIDICIFYILALTMYIDK